MNNRIKTTATLLTACIIATASFSQSSPDKMKSEDTQQDIIIHKKGDKTEKTTIIIEGDKVTINGKPVDDYKGDDVSIRKMRRYGPMGAPPARVSPPPPPPGNFNFEGFGDFMPAMGNKALLGVTTEKVEGGVKVTALTNESGADKAGLKKDDIITKVGDNKIETPGDLTAAIGKYKPADKVDIVYNRNGKENKVSATLGENKMKSFAFNMDDHDFNFEMPGRPPFGGSTFNWNRRPKIGLQIQDVEEGKGVKVNEVDDELPASKAGFKDDDVITDVNGKQIEGVDDLKEQIKDLKEGDLFKINFRRDGKPQTAEIKIPKRLKTADL